MLEQRRASSWCETFVREHLDLVDTRSQRQAAFYLPGWLHSYCLDGSTNWRPLPSCGACARRPSSHSIRDSLDLLRLEVAGLNPGLIGSRRHDGMTSTPTTDSGGCGQADCSRLLTGTAPQASLQPQTEAFSLLVVLLSRHDDLRPAYPGKALAGAPNPLTRLVSPVSGPHHQRTLASLFHGLLTTVRTI